MLVNQYNKSSWLFVVILLIQIIASLFDVLDDLHNNETLLHLGMNVMFGLVSFFGMVVLFVGIVKNERQITALANEVTSVKTTLAQQQEKASVLMGELAQIIHQQFDAWKLSDAEKEIALLLLKGLSLEEIARLRQRAQATIRQQASQVYTKAALSGRHELSAYFFEDLLI